MTEFEQSGKLKDARDHMRRREKPSIGWSWNLLDNPLLVTLYIAVAVPILVVLIRKEVGAEQRAFRDYRSWTFEQLALATSHLLGPDESMQTGETALFATSSFGAATVRDLAVVVTAAHVLILRIDSLDGQPRWVALAARPTDVNMKLRSGLFGSNPALVISRGNEQWAIRGTQRLFEPDPVLEAWQAATGTAHTG